MRTLTCFGLSASALLMSSCLDAESALMGPDAGADPAEQARATDDRLRIVEPADGDVLFAASELVLRMRQEVRAELGGGIGQVEFSPDGLDWAAKGEAFPWSAQETAFDVALTDIPEGKWMRLRVRIQDAASGATILASNEIAIACLPDAVPVPRHRHAL